MSDLYVLCGISGSGKSHYAEWLAKKTNAIIVSSDGVRGQIYGDENCQDNPKRVFDIAHSRIKKYLSIGKNVVFVASNLDKHRNDIIKYCSDIPRVHYELHVIPTSPSLCIERQGLRDRKVDEEVINRQFGKFSKIDFKNLHEGWGKVVYVYPCDDGYETKDITEEV